MEILADCAVVDGFQTTYYCVPLLSLMICWFLATLTPSYGTQKAYLMLLCNMAFADITLNLMLHNMTHRKFNPVMQKGLLFVLIPVFVILGLGLDGLVEETIIKCATLISFISFLFRGAIISKQYYDHSERSFWFRDPNPA